MLKQLKLKSISEDELIELADCEPMIHHFMLSSKITEDDSFMSYGGVYVKNGTPHLVLNPKKCAELQSIEKIGLLVHEYMHVVLSHCTKRTTLVDKWRQMENIAKDMAINQLIVKNGGWDLPEGGISHTDPRLNFPAELSSEEYFVLLREKFKTPEEFKDAMGDSCGFDDHSEWTESQGDSNVIKEMAKKYLRERKLANARGYTLKAGKHADSLIDEILTDTHQSVIDWKAETRKFLQTHLDDKMIPTYKRFSRRFGEPFTGYKRQNQAKVCAIVDTSGSMSDSYLSHIGAELNKMCSIMEVDIVFVDAAVQGVVEKHKPSAELKFPGRGGTDMQPGFDYAVENKYRCCICFTDGHLFSTPSCPLQTLWIVVNNNSFQSDFGKVVHVKWDE